MLGFGAWRGFWDYVRGDFVSGRMGERLGLCDGGSGRGAVTLILWLPILIMIFGRFTPAYQVGGLVSVGSQFISSLLGS